MKSIKNPDYLKLGARPKTKDYDVLRNTFSPVGDTEVNLVENSKEPNKPNNNKNANVELPFETDIKPDDANLGPKVELIYIDIDSEQHHDEEDGKPPTTPAPSKVTNQNASIFTPPELGQLTPIRGKIQRGKVA